MSLGKTSIWSLVAMLSSLLQADSCGDEYRTGGSALLILHLLCLTCNETKRTICVVIETTSHMTTSPRGTLFVCLFELTWQANQQRQCGTDEHTEKDGPTRRKRRMTRTQWTPLINSSQCSDSHSSRYKGKI